MPLWIFSILGGLRKALSALWGFVRANPLLAALIASLCLSAWLWRGWDKADARAAKWETAWVEMDKAQKAATAWAKAEAKRKAALASDIRESANAERKTAQEAGARAGDDYAARNRCVRVGPPASGSVRADLPAALPVAGQPTAEASEAELVGVSRPDFNACTVNTLDLENAYEWGQKMIAAGLAK